MKTLQNKFKLTPEAYKKIKITAQLIPKFQRRDKSGKLMFRTKSKFSDSEPVMVNHEVNLVQIFQKEGQAGMDAYVNFFMSQSSQNKIGKKENLKILK